MASWNRGHGHQTGAKSSHIHHTSMTVVAIDEESFNNCRTLIECSFGGLIHKYREHEEISLLSSSNIQTVYHCEFNVQYHGSDPDYFFKEFLQRCQMWCEFSRDYHWKLWMSTDMKAAFSSFGRTANVHQGIHLQGFSLGCMNDRWTFVEHYKHVSPLHVLEVDKKERDKTTRIDFEHDSRFLSLSFHCESESDIASSLREYRLRIRYDDLQEFLLVDDQQDSPLSVFFMLKAPPSFHSIERDGDEVNVARVTHTCCCAAEIIGNSSVLSLTITNESRGEFQSVISRFHAFNFKVHWSHVYTRSPTALSSLPTFYGDFEMAYTLECLRSQGFSITDRATGFFAKLSKLEPREYLPAQKALQQLALQVDPTLEGDRFIDLSDQFEINFQSAKDDDTEEEQYDNCKFVRRAIVTPTRCLLLPAELMAENRILRQFGEEFCMRVVFRDETFTKLSSFETSQGDEITRRVVDFLSVGVHVSDRHFEFLACSNSQLRDHGCWLYARDLEGFAATDIREWMGDFSDIKCVATYISRMGQCFSTSEESVKVPVGAGQFEREEDIKTEDKQYCFSDGIGRVSPSLAAKIAKAVSKKKVPSAYQIRYAGCKGVIAVDPTIEGDKLIVRTSMEKFQSSHEGLEIMNNSKPCRLFLNRQAITLLSGLGIEDDIFKELQENMLFDLGGMFFYDDKAAKLLSLRASQQTTINYRQVARAGISLTTEPFFRGLLLAVYRNWIGQLQRRARIEIPPSLGRNMVGVLDETGILNYGQVFVQYSRHTDKPQVGKTVYMGTVAVTKFPALHPGDFRKFDAIDVPELHHLVDCVVFPQRGKRPHPDEMAGSDLDGDEYFVTWMPELIFEGDNEHPMDFISPPKKIHEGLIKVPDMIKYIADYIKNDKVGLIANAHLAQADCQKDGIFSKVCIGIAEIHAEAVDFAKTGYSPDLKKDQRPHRYPDFMGKRDKTRYRSKKILGQLFRQCRQIDRIAIQQNESNLKDIPYDSALEHPGWQTYRDDAKRALDRYNRQLEAILTQYGITSENEALSGSIGKLSKRLTQRNEIHDAKNIITLKVKHIWNKTRRSFFEEFGGRASILNFPEESLAKASAWYITTYNQREKKYLSFPWVVADVLCEVRQRNPNALTITVPSVMRRLSIEAEEYRLMAADERLRSTIRDREPQRDLSVIFQHMRQNPWMRSTAGVLIEWRRKRALTKDITKIELLILLLGFKISNTKTGLRNPISGCDDGLATEPPLGDEDDAAVELLVEFLSFCASRKFHEKEHRHIPPGCNQLRLSKFNIRKISTAAEKAYHQLDLCGTLRSILQVDDNSNEEHIDETMRIGHDLFSAHDTWQRKLKEEFPKVEVSVRKLGGPRTRKPNAIISIRGPLSQVYEVQDRIEDWESDPYFIKNDLEFDLDALLGNIKTADVMPEFDLDFIANINAALSGGNLDV